MNARQLKDTNVKTLSRNSYRLNNLELTLLLETLCNNDFFQNIEERYCIGCSIANNLLVLGNTPAFAKRVYNNYRELTNYLPPVVTDSRLVENITSGVYSAHNFSALDVLNSKARKIIQDSGEGGSGYIYHDQKRVLNETGTPYRINLVYPCILNIVNDNESANHALLVLGETRDSPMQNLTFINDGLLEFKSVTDLHILDGCYLVRK